MAKKSNVPCIFNFDLFCNEYSVSVILGDKDYARKQLTKITKGRGDECDLYRERWAYPEFDLDCRGKIFLSDNYDPIIWVDPKGDEWISTLAHEAVHAVNWITRYIGENMRGEFAAHMVGCIVKEVLDKIDYKQNVK